MDLMDEMLVAKARRLAESAHAGQVDKSDAPYFEHVERVAARVDGGVHKAVAYLHDTLEDTSVAEQDLMAAGMPAEVIAAVKAITQHESEPRRDYYARVAANRYARTVKIADVADNSSPARMAVLDEPTRWRLVKKYAQARDMLAAPGDPCECVPDFCPSGREDPARYYARYCEGCRLTWGSDACVHTHPGQVCGSCFDQIEFWQGKEA